jgi:N-acetylglucosamine-6-phosphate deacetylase
MGKSGIYTADRIFTGREWLEGHAVITEDGRIKDLLHLSQVGSQPVEHFDEAIIAPAFIDIQIYGADGQLFSEYPTTEALKALVEHNRKGGTSLCLPTVATNDLSVFRDCIRAIRAYWEKGGQGIYGIHLEGPWINPLRKGAHMDSFIHAPLYEEVQELMAYGKGVIKLITLAPEVCPPEMILLLQENNILISAGHSNASYAEAKQAFASGIGLVTHTGAAMDDDTVMASIIPDGYHLDFAALRIAKKAMGDRLFVITDAVTETDTGHYQHILAGDRYEAAGILSGSALTLCKAVQHLVKEGGIEKGEALRMCSLYPARALRVDNERGVIAKGFHSEMVVLNEESDLIKLIN